MKIKKMLIVLAGIVLIAFLWIYLRFLGSHKIEKEKEMEAEAISVMAPYEVKQYQTVLKEIGEAYSQKSGNKKIEFEFIPEENIKKELLLRNLNKKNEVDMVICANTLMPELIRMGFFQELSVDQNTHQRVRQQTLWNSVKENGKIYGFHLPATHMFYFIGKIGWKKRILNALKHGMSLKNVGNLCRNWESKV